jgi:diguanylate cyclase (GGDEF)-like protein
MSPSSYLSPEELENRFWLRTVAAGGWASFWVGAAGLVYVGVYAHTANRVVIALIIGLVMAVGIAALCLVPWGRLARSRRRETVVLSWSLFCLVAITTMAALDGGARSPIAFAIVLPAIFASLAPSRRRVFEVGAVAAAALVILVLVGAPSGGTVLVGGVVLASAIVIAARQAEFHHEWRRQLAHHSRTDPLTGLLNRRGFAEASAGAFGPPGDAGVTLVLIDLDLFKQYNDVNGHHAGDDLLRWVGAELRAAVRPSDAVARIGGDEFAVLLPDTDAEAALPVVERLDRRLARRVPHSLGIASAPIDGPSIEHLYRVADAGLYERKFGRPGRSAAAL